jgi:hypothetical protein
MAPLPFILGVVCAMGYIVGSLASDMALLNPGAFSVVK